MFFFLTRTLIFFSCLVAVASRGRIAYIVKNYCDVWDIKGTFSRSLDYYLILILIKKKSDLSQCVSDWSIHADVACRSVSK